MFQVIFYEKSDGTSDLLEYIESLRIKSDKDKHARILYQKIGLYIQLLQNNGTMLPDSIVKNIEDGIWELRPANNRVLFFIQDGHGFVLLHHFVKKTQKTPRREIEKAFRERADYLSRMHKVEVITQ